MLDRSTLTNAATKLERRVRDIARTCAITSAERVGLPALLTYLTHHQYLAADTAADIRELVAISKIPTRGGETDVDAWVLIDSLPELRRALEVCAARALQRS
jgi:hypothetical protein